MFWPPHRCCSGDGPAASRPASQKIRSPHPRSPSLHSLTSLHVKILTTHPSSSLSCSLYRLFSLINPLILAHIQNDRCRNQRKRRSHTPEWVHFSFARPIERQTTERAEHRLHQSSPIACWPTIVPAAASATMDAPVGRRTRSKDPAFGVGQLIEKVSADVPMYDSYVCSYKVGCAKSAH